MPQKRARGTSNKGDFIVIGTLEEEISSLKVQAPQGGSQDCEGREAMGVLGRELGSQEDSQGGKQDLENKNGVFNERIKTSKTWTP